MKANFHNTNIALSLAQNLLRISSAYLRCASHFKSIFTWFMTTGEEDLRKGGNHVFFGDNKVSIWKKFHTLLCTLKLFRILVS